jgi:hypothetical protein
MTVEYLIYALGGGHGHARRGLLLQQHLALRGVASVVLVRPGSDCHFAADYGPRHYAQSLDDPGLVPLLRSPPPRLVVDTFPQGWRGEIESCFLARFEQAYWIARYVKTMEAIPSGFGRILSPYPEGKDEWDRGLVNAIPTGYLVDSSHWRLSSSGRCFAVFDPEGRCSAPLLTAFARAAKLVGLELAYHSSLSLIVKAAKLLVVGAGYNTFYELLSSANDVRFLPVRKRHDDQFRRVGLFGLGLTHLDQLLPWLDAPHPGDIDYAMPDWSAVVNALEV